MKERGGYRLSTSVVSKRGSLPSISYFVQDVTDVDGSFRQPAQCHEALIFLAVDIPGGVFPAATILRINSRSVGSASGVTSISTSLRIRRREADAKDGRRAG